MKQLYFSDMSLSICCIFFSNIFFESTKPMAVLPKLFGPELVGVFLPMFRILIFASAGISSTSSSLSSLNALATEGLANGTMGFLAGALSLSWIDEPDFDADMFGFKFIEILETRGGGGGALASRLFFLETTCSLDDELLLLLLLVLDLRFRF